MCFFLASTPHEDAVMAGLIPAIHVFLWGKDVDARDKPGHDEVRYVP
jgi:hypothetical protein